MWPTSSDSMMLRNNSKRNQVCKPSLEETAPVHIAIAKIGLHETSATERADLRSLVTSGHYYLVRGTKIPGH